MVVQSSRILSFACWLALANTCAAGVAALPSQPRGLGPGSIAAGEQPACALATDAAVKCRGHNNEGQLGDSLSSDDVTSQKVLGSPFGGYLIFLDGFETEAAPPMVSLNDTGQNWCANDSANFLSCPQAGFPDQDGDHGRDALASAGQLTKIGGGEAGFDYTKISNSGQPLGAGVALGTGAGDWGCTRDNLIGLIWEVKLNDAASLRHMDHTYTWYDTNAAINGGNAGTIGAAVTCNSTLTQCNTSAFVAAVNAQGLCGANDWRMPTPQELQGIVHTGTLNPAIDTGYFPNTSTSGNAAMFWAGRNYAVDASSAWYVYFNIGSVFDNYKSSNYGVRLVRGGQ